MLIADRRMCGRHLEQQKMNVQGGGEITFHSDICLPEGSGEYTSFPVVTSCPIGDCNSGSQAKTGGSD